MTSVAIVRAQFGFNQAMNERLWNIIMEHLTDGQFVREMRYSRGSIQKQMLHMASAHRYWFRGLFDAPESDELAAEDYPTREAARQICQQIDQEAVDRVNGLTEAELERIPDIWSQPVWVALMQLAHHSTDHRSQILHALHDMGTPTFDQSFVLYQENATPMTAQALIGHIGQRRGEWDDMLRQVPAEKMDQSILNRWTVRDVIAIVTWKERRMVEMIRGRAFMEASFSQLAEAEQASILERSRVLPMATLIEQHEATHQEMLEAIRTLTEEILNSEDISGLPPGERFWKAIAWTTWWSYPGFAAPLRTLLQ